jgi:plasmid stabilization system protein ParE
MEERITCKPLIVSGEFRTSRKRIYNYTLDTFGYFQAERYLQQINSSLATLPAFHTAYPECRHLATKSRMYRNIILDAHLIIYRITDERIEVLDIPLQASAKFAKSVIFACNYQSFGGNIRIDSRAGDRTKISVKGEQIMPRLAKNCLRN